MVLRASRTVLALSVRGYGNFKSIGSKVGDLTEEVHRFFCISALQNPVGRAHAAHAPQLAGQALCLSSGLLSAHLQQEILPPLLEAALPEVVAFAVPEHAGAQLSGSVDRKSIVAPATGVELTPFLRDCEQAC